MSSSGKFIEENILSLLDSSLRTKDTQYANDDRHEFLVAVRAAFLCLDHGTRPSNEIYEEIFHILRVGKSMELIMESHCLLDELEKCFVRHHVSASSGLPMTHEAWSPFSFNSNVLRVRKNDIDKNCTGLLDSVDFHNLIKELAEFVDQFGNQSKEITSRRNMLLFQYLVNILNGDFTSRKNVYQETMDWSIVRESLLSSLLSSRSINYKALFKDLVSLLCGMFQSFSSINCEAFSHLFNDHSSENADNDVQEYVYYIRQSTTQLLTSIMELDVLRNKADGLGLITRADNVRIPLIDIIIDELTYDKDTVSPFLLAFDDSKWKLEIVLQYFSKYSVKSIRTRQSRLSNEDSNFTWMMGCFANITSAKSLTKKIGSHVVQVLLAQAFQAQLSEFTKQQDEADISCVDDECGSTDLHSLCNSFVSAFITMKKANEKMEISSFGREALFAAATILSSRRHEKHGTTTH